MMDQVSADTCGGQQAYKVSTYSLLTPSNFMAQFFVMESHSTGQDIFWSYKNMDVHYRFHTSSAMNSIPNQLSPIYTLTQTLLR
jgi:hypothetical protein